MYIQVHDVEYAPSIDLMINETLTAVQKLKEKGLCRYIGITGYPLDVMRNIITQSSVKIDSILLYCHLSLNDNSLTEHFEFLNSHRVPIIYASPLSLCLLTESGGQDWNPASQDIKDACRRAVEYSKDQGVDITRIAVNHSTSYNEVSSMLIVMYYIIVLKTFVYIVCTTQLLLHF